MLRGLLFILLVAVAAVNAQEYVEYVDGVEYMMEPFIVPEPTDGVSRWWYTPSRKAHLHRHRYPSADSIVLDSKANEDLRLSGDLKPVSYNVRLLPFLDVGNFTTDGYVEIVFNCIRATSNITLSSNELTIDSSSVSVSVASNNNPVAVTSFIDEQDDRQFITVQVASPLVAGQQYKVAMKFISILNAQLRGFYRSSYVENGVTKYLAVTQYEPTDARRSFPCFDEPTYKANFTMTLGRKTSFTSASNMPLVSTAPIEGMPGYVWDQYEPSIIMSSYLVAALVSEFQGIPAPDGLSNVLFRIWARPDAANLTDYSLNIGPRILEFFEGFYGIDYPLPKQDLAAIPDFAAGAMENWGLITYREQYLLIDLNTASARAHQFSAIVTAHELAHQWFGDLVTMDWWNALWLNEGFASYMEYLGTDSVEPTFRMNEQFILENLQYVFGVDSLETSRPINIEVNTPLEINSLFDAISYEKGSCVIRMLADFLGFDTFKRGLTRYLTTNAYGNANQDDLWQAMQDQANQENVALPTTVKAIMDSWTYKMNYPLITVTRNYQTGAATVTQERFLLRKSNDSTDTTVYRWWVPLTYVSVSSPKARQWLPESQPSTVLSNVGAGANQWVIFNVDQENYYRVAYDLTNYGLIRDQLVADHSQISILNRAQLLDDSFVLASISLVPYAQALDMSLYLDAELEYVPWHAVTTELSYINNMLFGEREYTNWVRYMTTQITPYFNSVGFQESPTDAHFTILGRTDAMTWACKMEVPGCVQGARNQYAALMQDPTNDRIISINQRSIVLRTAIENGGVTEWNFAFDRYQITGDVSYLIAMCYSKDPLTIQGLLDMILDPNSGINSNNYNTLFNNVAHNPIGNDIALDFLINRWSEIQTAVGVSNLPSWFRYLCDLQNTQEGYNKLVQLRDAHPTVLGTNTVQQGLDVVQRNIDWMVRHQAEVGSWLATH